MNLFKPFIFFGVFFFGSMFGKSYHIHEFEGFSSPESVYVYGDFVYVSNVGTELAPLNKDGDGYISKLDKNGRVIDKHFIKNIDAPKGMSVMNGILYVVDIDILRGFQLDTGREVFNLPIKDAIFLNDIAVKSDGILYVSDTGTGMIHEVNVNSRSYQTLVKIPKKYMGPNGLLIKGGDLITVTYDPNGKDPGRVLKIDLKTLKITPFSSLSGPLDGVAVDSMGNLLVTSWGKDLKGKLYSINKIGTVKEVNIPDMKGPADIFFDSSTKVLWIPKMAENSIIKVEF